MAFAALLLIGTAQKSQAQTDETATTTQQLTEQTMATTPVDQDTALPKEIKRLFIEGGAGFMGVILLCLILGLAISIERIIYLNLATTNTEKYPRTCGKHFLPGPRQGTRGSGDG